MREKNKSIQSIALDFLEYKTDDSFVKIISRLKPGLLSFAYKFVNDLDISKEVVSKTFIAVWEKIDQYDTKYNFSTWVYAIAKNEALGQLRLKKKVLSHDKLTENQSRLLKFYNPVFNMDIETYGPSGEDITYHLYDKVVDEIQGIDEPYKTVLVEREINKKSLQEIADLLNWNLSTVKTRLRKARLEIAKKVKSKHPSLLESYYEEKNN